MNVFYLILELLSSLASLLHQRDELIRVTSVKVNQHSFLRSLMLLKSSVVFESDFKEYFSQFETDLLDNVKLQDPILNELSTYMAEFNKINQNNPLAIERIEAVQKVVDSMQLYDEFCMDFI